MTMKIIPTIPKVASSPRIGNGNLSQSLQHEERLSEHSNDASKIILGEILSEFDVHLGGSSIGRGFRHAAHFYLKNKAPDEIRERIMHMGIEANNDNCGNLSDEKKQEESKISSDDLMPGILSAQRVEEPFYVCDLGAVVSQYYQWKKMLPRVEVFYAVKCNPDIAVLKTLLKLGANFDCASRNEFNLVLGLAKEMGMTKNPDIIFANPCKPPAHIIEAVCKGVRMVTFDNVEEVKKCASISKKIQLVLRIVTDDTGSQCRLSSKFGAPKSRWRPLLMSAKRYGLEVVGVSFHVGSGCRDSSRYDLALRDAKELFEMAEKDYGFKMHILDIGGGFPGETHSLWNPADYIDSVVNEEIQEDFEVEKKEGLTVEEVSHEENDKPLNFFADIAEHVTPKLDEIFPPNEWPHLRVIGEPGRYLVAAAFTLVASVTSVRDNAVDFTEKPEPISDRAAAKSLDLLTRDEERDIIDLQANPEHAVIETIVEELQSYSKLYASQNLVQQEVDCWQDKSDVGMLEAPDRMEVLNAEKTHTAEGVTLGLVAECLADDESRPRSRSNSVFRSRSNSVSDGVEVKLSNTEEFANSVLTIAAAGEAAVSGVVIQAVADSAPYQDDFAYYVNDGVYGAFNNLMFDHASVRPRVLRNVPGNESSDKDRVFSNDLYSSTIFGPTCDSIDVISRSILLPKLEVGDWLYFQNMGAYTCAAASSFNGFMPSKKFYVCSVQPEDFLLATEESFSDEEEKKTSC